jgi:hypothetical protein
VPAREPQRKCGAPSNGEDAARSRAVGSLLKLLTGTMSSNVLSSEL